MKSLFLLSVIAAFARVCLAQDNPVCCACGVPDPPDAPCANITNPDIIIQLPDIELLPVSEASCSLIKQAGEDLRLIPAEVSAPT